MNALALVIGISAYPKKALKNAVNDAKAISQVLQRLGFMIKTVVDADYATLDSAIDEFGNDLNNYNIGLLYYAGHGIQISGENYITATDTPFANEMKAKFQSVNLNTILTYMDHASNETNIVILDACRNNPFERMWTRSIVKTQLAPMYAPKGTLIAYSTSPGQTADDGDGDHSPYAKAILQHIEVRGIFIEEFFKRVRNSVYSFTEGEQTSWEHTSLTGTFVFNSGQLIQSVNTPYSEMALADSRYEYDNGNDVDLIVKRIKTHNYEVQNNATSAARSINVRDANSDQLFVIGRNIISAATGGAFTAERFMNNLETHLPSFNEGGGNHLLNGMLYEVYFNSEGRFRFGNYRTSYLSQLLKLRSTPEYQKAFEFINLQLVPFQDELFYVPGPHNHSISLNLEGRLVDVLKSGKETSEIKISYFEVDRIKYEGKDILEIEHTKYLYNPFEEVGNVIYREFSLDELESKIATELGVIPELLTLSFNADLNGTHSIKYPRYSVLTKKNVGSNHIFSKQFPFLTGRKCPEGQGHSDT